MNETLTLPAAYFMVPPVKCLNSLGLAALCLFFGTHLETSKRFVDMRR
jgi:hypothetical protein